MENRDHAIEGLKKYITDRGLEVSGIEPNADGSVRVCTTTSNIRTINLKEFMDYSGYTEYRIGYDAVDFYPEQVDVYVFEAEVLTEDPTLKIEEVKQGLVKEFEGVIQPSEIEVKQKMGRKVADGTNNFVFTVTSNKVAGQLAEQMYLHKMIPPTSMAQHVADMLSTEERKTFGVDDTKAQLAVAPTNQLRALKEELFRAVQMSGKFGVVDHTKDICTRIAMIDEVLETRYDEDEDEDEEQFFDEDEAEEIVGNVGMVIGVVNLEKEQLARMSDNELLKVQRHLEDARESAGCLPILRDSINSCLALIAEIKREK